MLKFPMGLGSINWLNSAVDFEPFALMFYLNEVGKLS